MQMVRVLFVCTGNICRSPTAEAVLRKAVEEAHMTKMIECDSAGLGGWFVGRAPDPIAVSTAARSGYEMTGLRGRQVDKDDFAKFDLLIAMDHSHVDALKKLRPSVARGSVALFLSYSPHVLSYSSGEVPDPYGGEAADFDYALKLIEQGTPGLLAAIKKEFF